VTQESTLESAASERPFKYYGKQGEWTLIAPLKPGAAAELRANLDALSADAAPRIGLIKILHNVRVALIDNDTRMLFATIYDGTWDQYIDDFAAHPVLKPALDHLWGHLDGYPGLESPDVKDYFIKYQAPVAYFWTAYPDSTVERIQKGERVLAGFEQVLDAAG
jgi:hypothetical protein